MLRVIKNKLRTASRIAEIIRKQLAYDFSVRKIFNIKKGSKKTLCLFIHFDKDNIIDDYVINLLHHIDSLEADIVFITNSSGITAQELKKINKFCTTCIVRNNVEYDFGGWAHALRHVTLDNYDRLILANDSVYGPFFDLKKIFETMNAKKMDMWGITDSYEIAHHIQSYFLVLNKNVIRDRMIIAFLTAHKATRDQWDLIRKYEIGLSQLLQKNDYRIGAYCAYDTLTTLVKNNAQLHANPCITNPSIEAWKILIEHLQDPFMKTRLLKEKVVPSQEWEPVITKLHYNIDLIKKHLARFS